MISVTVNVAEVDRALAQLNDTLDMQIQRGLEEAGSIVRDLAREYSPVSPTKAQVEAASGRVPPYRFRPGRRPGTLRDSIAMEKGNGFIDVGVFRGPAEKYAFIQHYPPSHWRPGPGTVAQGVNAGPAYLDRAAIDSEDDINEALAGIVGRATARFNYG